MDKWITAIEIQNRWKCAAASVFDAVRRGLPVYEEAYNGTPKRVEIDVFNKHFSKMHDSVAIKTWFPVLLFKESDILEIEGVNVSKELTCHALLKQPVFIEVIEAFNTILVYCEANRPAKRDAAFDLCNQRHKGISKSMFERIWMTVPDAMKRTAGQKDENLKPKTE